MVSFTDIHTLHVMYGKITEYEIYKIISLNIYIYMLRNFLDDEIDFENVTRRYLACMNDG